MIGNYLKVKTEVIKKNCNPEWNTVFNLDLPSSCNPAMETISFEVYDYDRFSANDLLGKASTSLGTLMKGKSQQFTMKLHNAKKGSITVELLAEDFGVLPPTPSSNSSKPTTTNSCCAHPPSYQQQPIPHQQPHQQQPMMNNYQIPPPQYQNYSQPQQQPMMNQYQQFPQQNMMPQYQNQSPMQGYGQPQQPMMYNQPPPPSYSHIPPVNQPQMTSVPPYPMNPSISSTTTTTTTFIPPPQYPYPQN